MVDEATRSDVQLRMTLLEQVQVLPCTSRFWERVVSEEQGNDNKTEVGEFSQQR